MKTSKTLLFALALALSAPTLANAATPSACEAFSTTMTSRILGIFHNKAETQDQKQEALAQLFQEAVDTNWIGKFALGPYWRTAPQTERKAYLDTFRDYLTNIYISKFHAKTAMDITNIKLLSIVPRQDNLIFVKSVIMRKPGFGNTQVNYILKQTPHSCQVHDIRVAGVSLLVTLRSEFGAAASASGVKGVIAQMKSRLAANE